MGSLWFASLCPEGCFGLFFGSEAVVGWQRKASLEKLAGNRWFWGSGVDVGMLRKASLGEGWWYLQEWFWRGGSGGTERRFVVEDMERRPEPDSLFGNLVRVLCFFRVFFGVSGSRYQSFFLLTVATNSFR